MERKIWLKPIEGGKPGYLKEISEKDGEAALLECLFLDTADAGPAEKRYRADDLRWSGRPEAGGRARKNRLTALRRNTMRRCRPGDWILRCFRRRWPKSCAPPSGTSSCTSIFASAFEEKTRLIVAGEGKQYLMARLLGHFEDDDLKGELCAIELKAEGESAASKEGFAAKLAIEAKLERSVSPWFEAMRIKTSGFQPVITEKKLKKYVDTRIMQPPALRLFELVKAYIALNSLRV